jgi:hypothetical protein
MLNAFLFHAFLDLLGIGAAALAVIMSVFLLFKTKITLVALKKRSTLAEMAKKYELHPNQISL